jgi:hypothetical protein
LWGGARRGGGPHRLGPALDLFFGTLVKLFVAG